MGQICFRRPAKDGLITEKKPFSRKTANNAYFRSDQSIQTVVMQDIETSIKNTCSSFPNDDSANIQIMLQQAKEQNNIQIIIQYMSDNTPIRNFNRLEHAWAESPKTIGSLAMMFMGFMIMREVSPQEIGYNYQEIAIETNIKKIAELKIYDELKKNLLHENLDRVQMTILFLVFFVDYSQFHNQIIDNGLFQIIIPYMFKLQKYPIGFRLATGFVLRSLFKGKRKLVSTVINEKKYLESLQDILQSKNQQFIIEGIFFQKGLNSIDDLMYSNDEQHQINFDSCNILYKQGFFEVLQKVQLDYIIIPNNQIQDNDNFTDEKNIIIEIINSLLNKLIQQNSVF